MPEDTSAPRLRPAPSNVFGRILLTGLLRDQRGELEVTMGKLSPKANPPFISRDVKSIEQPNVPHPPHPAIRHGPNGNLQLALDVGREIGHGRVGRVYEATICLPECSSAVATLLFPPLVVKISRKGKADALRAEAQNYRDMQPLQGIVIPRFYGLFAYVIPDEVQFTPWQEEGLDRGISQDLNAEPHPAAVELPENAVTVLVMERVGGRLPVRKYSVEEKREISCMYADLSAMGICHAGFEYGNVLYAPEDSPLKSRKSPLWGKPYRFRIIDFDQSTTTNLKKQELSDMQCCAICFLLDDIPFQATYNRVVFEGAPTEN